MEWTSPDLKIKKVILVKGIGHTKPTECCECTIRITDSDVNFIRIGDTDGEFQRNLDTVLQTMHTNEISTVHFNDAAITLELIDFTSKGLIYEWDAKFKYDLASEHKSKGVDLFKSKNTIDASHRFSKALKILLSIPIDVQNTPTVIDGIDVFDILGLKSNLFNNLASCCLKVKNYKQVGRLCEKVLGFDKDNVKASYKLGVSCYEQQDYDRAVVYFKKVLESEPDNTAVIDYVKNINIKLKEENYKYNQIVKKMFQ